MVKDGTDPYQLLDVKEVAEILDLAVKTVRIMVARRQIPCVCVNIDGDMDAIKKIGRKPRRKVMRRDLEEFIRQRRVASDPEPESIKVDDPLPSEVPLGVNPFCACKDTEGNEDDECLPDCL
jgi:hypothetical protein